MQIISPSFEDNGVIPTLYTCDGEDIHPHIEFLDLPIGTESLALLIEDPDHNGEVFTHWTIWGIDPENPVIEEDMLQEGVIEGQTSFGECGYHGPCPKKGSHRYLFRAFALNDNLGLTELATREQFDESISDRMIEYAEITAYYPEKYIFDKNEL